MNELRFSIMASFLLQYACVIVSAILITCEILFVAKTTAEQKTQCYSQGSVACKMWNYTNMDCNSRRLACVPALPKTDSITLLDLSANSLLSIPGEAFHEFNKLKHLDLSINTISVLYDDAFSGLHELLVLKLFLNSLTYIQDHIFTSLHNLQDLDISQNEISFVHDGAFIGLYDLRSLNLMDNQISFITDKVFGSLRNLRSLNLLLNFMRPLPNFPFQNLISLRELKLSWQNLSSLSSTSFPGLKDITNLHISFQEGFDNITGTPLALLTSLRELYIDDVIHSCDNIGRLFIGLHSLQYLDIFVGGFCPEIMFCSSYDEYSYPVIGDVCNLIPLTHLKFEQAVYSTSLPSFKVLSNLTSLEFTTGQDFQVAVAALNSLDSPLQNLTLNRVGGNIAYLNSTTFSSWRHWKMSLEVFKIYFLSFGKFVIEGTPFQWFTELQVLNLYSANSLTIQMNAFKGLISLNTLTVLSYETTLLSESVFSIFSTYNSLATLDLSHNKLKQYNDMSWERKNFAFHFFPSYIYVMTLVVTVL